MLGSMAVRYFRASGDHVITLSSRFSADDPRPFFAELKARAERRPFDLTINAIGAIPQRISHALGAAHAEDRFAEARWYAQLNVLLPLRLRCSGLLGILVHPSTDCVFAPVPPVGVTERAVDAPHDASDLYGRSKSLGEQVLALGIGRTLVIRSSIIGPGGGLMRWVSECRGTVQGYTNHLWNGLTTLHWCQLADSLSESMRSRGGNGELHQPGTAVVTKAELLESIVTVFAMPARVVPSGSPEGVTGRVLRPTLQRPPIKMQLSEMREFMDRTDPMWRRSEMLG